jgi:hypothetical protein
VRELGLGGDGDYLWLTLYRNGLECRINRVPPFYGKVGPSVYQRIDMYSVMIRS